jgi:hypothetical protein
VHGRADSKGEIVDSTVVGLHPAGDSPIPWLIGHVIPVPAETGPSDGDTEEQYVTARYRVILSESKYRDLLAYIRELEARSPVWHALFYNCNMYGQKIAIHLGLKIPSTVWVYPNVFIAHLREANEGQPQEKAVAL